MTRERVLYGHASSPALDRPHRVLGRDDAFVWFAVEDAVARELVAAGVRHEVLYFAIEDYEQAMRGLVDAEVQDAVERRRAYWSPDAPGQTLVAAVEDERRRLALAARAGRARYLEAGLERLSALGVEDAKRALELDRVVELLVYDEASIAEELSRAGRAAEAQRAAASARALAVELAGLGLPNYARALPVTTAFRVVQFERADPELVAALRGLAVQALPWEGGLLVSLSLRQYASLAPGHASRIIAYDGLAYARTVDQAAAQRRRDLRLLLARPPQALAEDWVRNLDEQRLAQTAVKVYLRHSGRAPSSLAALLDAQLADEIADLLSSVMPAAPGDLAGAHAAAIVDTRWFADLARSDGLGGLPAELERHLDHLTGATALLGA